MKFFAILILAAVSSRGAGLLVAAASDLSPLTAAIEQGFARSGGGQVRFTLASSGSLAQQIENGAPFDVFLSANDKFVQDLAAAGRLDASTIVTYALGRIALWSPNSSASS